MVASTGLFAIRIRNVTKGEKKAATGRDKWAGLQRFFVDLDEKVKMRIAIFHFVRRYGKRISIGDLRSHPNIRQGGL